MLLRQETMSVGIFSHPDEIEDSKELFLSRMETALKFGIPLGTTMNT